MSDSVGYGQQRTGLLPVAADTQIAKTAGRGFYVSALLHPGSAACTLTVFDGPAANNKVLAFLEGVANGQSVGEQLTHPVAFSGGDGTQGLHYTLTGLGAQAQIGFK